MADVPITAAATFCATLVDEWARCGITHAVVAPGSRSTPLALALSADDRVRVHVHHDERSAAYLALGLALATGLPAPVVPTSGTAAVELHPAVVEAHHAQVPMICATADRPPELRDVGAPQTIDQTHLFGSAVRWFTDPGVPDTASSSMGGSIAGGAVAAATGTPAGPVHVNLPFRDPLVGRPGDLPPARSGGRGWHVARSGGPATEPPPPGELAESLVGRRGVILAGSAGGGRPLDATAVHDLARALGWPVIADPRSGCRVPEGTTISHADALLRHQGFANAHRPEVVLQLGDRSASKVVGQWIAGSGAELVLVHGGDAWFDPDRQAAARVAADPSRFAVLLAQAVRTAGVEPDAEGPIESWAAADAAASDAIAVALAAHPEPTEPAVARDLVACLAEGTALVVSSSMPVRDVEWYAGPRRGLRVIANRGANGIDGVVSTAVGVALSGAPTALLIGDIALLHDTNGLLGATQRSIDLTIVVVDNDGGGIFSFLPQADALPHERFEQLFGTPHGVDLAALAAAHGLEVDRIERQADLGPVVVRAQAEGGVRMVYVGSERQENVRIHDEIHAEVARSLDRLVA
jgi:2-succinyl-5-enolpyruvyl-6-hydroxy-3-cyclohexene-1-carboxylate synthase